MTATETEIREGCAAIEATFETRSRLATIADAIAPASRYYFLGCGSSYWVGAIAAHWFRAAGVDATAVTASEFYFDDYAVDGETVAVAYSQSGETTETVRALAAAADGGAQTVSITNVADSTLAETADTAYVTPAGPEESVLATKSSDAAVTASYVLSQALDGTDTRTTWTAETCRSVTDLAYTDAVETFNDAEHAYTLGTGIDYGLAGEAARKLGEGPLLHSTPMPALEISHGPRANVAGDPVLLVLSDQAMVDHYTSLVEELREAGARVVTIQPEDVSLSAESSVRVPHGDPQFLYTLKAIQCLTLELALDRGIDPDDPPSLTKHVERDGL